MISRITNEKQEFLHRAQRHHRYGPYDWTYLQISEKREPISTVYDDIFKDSARGVSAAESGHMHNENTDETPQHHQRGSNDGSPNHSPGDGASVEQEPTPDAGPSRIGSFTRAEQTPIAVWSEGQLEAALRFANGLPQGSLCGVKFESVGICQKVTLTYMIHSNAKQSVDILSAENAGNSSRQLHPNKRVILTSITSGGIENTKRVLQNVGLRVPGRSVF